MGSGYPGPSSAWDGFYWEINHEVTFQEHCLGCSKHPYLQQSIKMATRGDPLKRGDEGRATMLILLVLSLLVRGVTPLKTIKFTSSVKARSTSFNRPPGAGPGGDRTLRQWFEEPTAMATLLGAAETVKRERPEPGAAPSETFIITTAGPAFPGLTVSSQNTVRIERQSPSSASSSSSISSSSASPLSDAETYASLSLVLVDTKLKAAGPKLLVNIFESTLPDLELQSLNRVRVVDAVEAISSAPSSTPSVAAASQTTSPPSSASSAFSSSSSSSSSSQLAILSEVSLTAELQVPSWVPIPAQLLESRGSKAFQGLLDRDVSRLIERFKNDYLEWAAP